MGLIYYNRLTQMQLIPRNFLFHTAVGTNTQYTFKGWTASGSLRIQAAQLKYIPKNLIIAAKNALIANPAFNVTDAWCQGMGYNQGSCIVPVLRRLLVAFL